MKKIYSFLLMFLTLGFFNAQTYNVTFQLNTASIISGGGSIATSMYVGGGVVGDAMALQLCKQRSRFDDTYSKLTIIEKYVWFGLILNAI